jgi:hypothetical protein
MLEAVNGNHEERFEIDDRRLWVELLISQLQPKGYVRGCLDRVYSTGNGCYTMIGI